MAERTADLHHYTQTQLRQMLGLSRHAIARLVDLGFVVPTRGPGRTLKFSFRDLVLLRSAQDLRKAGIGTRQILRSLGDLRRALPADLPLSDLRVMATGDRVTVRKPDESVPLWEAASGQMVMDFSVRVASAALSFPAPQPALTSGSAKAVDLVQKTFEMAEALEESDPLAAEIAYQQLLAGNPGYANAYLNLGFMYCEAERFREAAALYEAAALHCADDPLIHFNRGVALAALHRSAEAVASYERALALRPELADAHQNAALLYAQLGQEQLAIRHFSAYRRLQRSAQ